MKNIYPLFFLLLLLISSCSDEEIYNEQEITEDEGLTFEAIVPETTKTISTETWEAAVSNIDTVNQTMTLASSIEDNMELNEGDILVSEYDGGYLLQIETITRTDDQIYLTTSESTLEDAIEDADFWYDTPLTNSEVDEIESLSDGATISLNDTKSNNTKSNLSVNISANLTDEDEIFSLGINGSVTLSSDIRTKLKIKRFKLRKFEIGYSGSISTELTGSISVTTEKDSTISSTKELEKDIASIAFNKIVVYCGSVPILVEPKLTLSAGVRVSAVASATIGLTDELSFSAGITYVRGTGWGNYKTFDHEFSLLRPTGEVEVSAECYIEAKLKYKIYKKLSPYIEFPIYGGVRAGANTEDGFYYDLYAGAALNAGAKMKIFGKNQINYNAEIFSVETYLNQAPESPSNPSPEDKESVDYQDEIKLSWTGKDYNKDDELTYTVYASTDESKLSENAVATNIKNNYYTLSDITADQSMYWQVIAKDSDGDKTSGPIWSFTVGSSQIAPSTPQLIAPTEDSKGLDPESIEFSWESDDEDVNPVFTILLGTDKSSLESIYEGTITKEDDVYKYTSSTILNSNTTYYWQVVAANDDLSESSEIASFVTSIPGAISFTDSRDGNTYAAVKIGDDYWMSENLKYTATSSSKYSKVNDVVYYSYLIMDDVCPSGWHIPTTDEYDAMYEELNMETKGTLQLLDPDSFSNGSNTSGFSATSTGTNWSGSIEGNEAAYYLKYTDSEEGEWPYFMYLDEEVSYWDNSDPDSKLTIRCVRDK
ncbi:FISUMP domain-containing protein [Labilibaculum sp.]|uniref:FISUMP domain-containing protein n=1 Tax=Labilibaculum sp. TaxID=2060723 RepID=UPI003561EFD0